MSVGTTKGKPADDLPKRKKARPHRLRRRLVIAAIAVVAVIVVAVIASHVYVDWLWYGEVGLRTIFWRRLAIGAIVGVVFAAVFFAVVYGNLEIARRLAPKYRPIEGLDVIEAVNEPALRWVRRVGLLAALFGALIAGRSAVGAWLIYARALDFVPFGIRDPIFHHDLSFYVFRLPAWQYAYEFLFAALIVALIISVAAHFAVGGLEIHTRGTPLRHESPETWARMPPAARAAEQVSRVRGFEAGQGAIIHISALVAALFFLGGLGYLFEAWDLLYSTAGVVFGAGYTDVHVRLPLIRVMMILAFVLGGALVYNAVRRRRSWWPVAAFGIWLAALIVLLGIVPAVWQSLIVNPNQLAKEKPYIAFNIAATRAAYDLTAISKTPYSLKGDLSAAALKVNNVTVRNIRLWDPQVLLRSYSQLQELRPYYSFTTVSVDRYSVNGVYTQTMLAPRELRVSGLPSQAQTWVNQHITYTHGYGVARVGGEPGLFRRLARLPRPGRAAGVVGAVAHRHAAADLLRPPRHELRAGQDTKYPTFDYPGPNGDVYSQYTGSGGIPIGSFLNRLAFTLRFGDIRFFTTSAITGPEPGDHPRTTSGRDWPRRRRS